MAFPDCNLFLDSPKSLLIPLSEKRLFLFQFLEQILRCNVYAGVNIDLSLCEHVCMVIGLQNTILPLLCKQCMAVDSKPTIKPDDEKEDVILCKIWNLFEISYIFIRYWVGFVYWTFIINHNHVIEAYTTGMQLMILLWKAFSTHINFARGFNLQANLQAGRP